MKKLICIVSSAVLLALSCVSASAMPVHSWHKTQLPAGNSLRGSAVYGESLWVTGSNNGVFRSVNNGKSWQNVSVKSEIITDFRDIELFDEQTAIVMGVGTGKLSALYKTTDAGKNWQLLFANPEKSGFFDAIDFWDRNTGLLLGDPVDGYYVIYKTTDGGKSFKRIAKNKIPPLRKGEGAFAASGSTLIVGKAGKAWFTTGGEAAHVYESQDYGESWTREAVPLHDKTSTSGGYSLALNDKGQVFVIGGDYKQRDGDYVHIATKVVDTWVIPGGEVGKGLRTAMQCSGSLCLNTGKLLSSISVDGGANWKLFAFEGYYTMAVNSKASDGKTPLFLMAGNNGRIGVISFR